MVKKEANNSVTWGVIVETEAYSQKEPACHGFKKRTPTNESLFGTPGKFYVYSIYGIYFCINIVTYKSNWADGVLLRAIAMPNENEKIASGPGLLAKRFSLNKTHDNLLISRENGIWLTEAFSAINMKEIVQTTRVGIKEAKYLRWRWYLQKSRSVSKRAKGDNCPSLINSWQPSIFEGP